MSTSYLVNKMKQVAEQHQLKVTIKAVPEPQVDVHAKEADVIMLGPQIAFLEEKIKARVNIPVETINKEDFGKINAGNVLKRALTIVKESR